MAIKTQNTVVYVQTALASAKTITAASLGSPGAGEVTITSATHGYTDGDIIKITGVGGMQQINNRAFIVDNATTNTFTLKGTNASVYTAYTSGGSAYKATMSAVGEVRDIPELGGTEPNEFDVSHLLSVAEEKLAGLPKQSNISFNVWFDLTTANHQTLLDANGDLVERVFRFYRPSSFNLTVVAQVGGFRITAGDVNSAYSGTVSLIPRAAGAWSLTT
jgi:hypothetical protein